MIFKNKPNPPFFHQFFFQGTLSQRTPKIQVFSGSVPRWVRPVEISWTVPPSRSIDPPEPRRVCHPKRQSHLDYRENIPKNIQTISQYIDHDRFVSISIMIYFKKNTCGCGFINCSICTLLIKTIYSIVCLYINNDKWKYVYERCRNQAIDQSGYRRRFQVSILCSDPPWTDCVAKLSTIKPCQRHTCFMNVTGYKYWM